MMKAFFSKRKNGGKSNSDSSLYPPPSLTSTTRRAHMSAADVLDYASSPTSTVSSSASGSAAAPWDGKCARCRKLMSRCLCHEEETLAAAAPPPSARAHGYADEFMFPTERSAANARSGSVQAEDAKPDKRMLLETLSGMHQSRSRSRVPLKMTQDRSRDRRMRESQRMPNHTVLSASTSSFTPTRSVGPSKSVAEDDDRFTRSCPDVKWRSSSAITSTMRLAHDRDVQLPPRSGQPKNLLAYDNKKLTNRYNHAHSSAATTTATTATSATSNKPLPRTASGNLYISEPISRRRRDNEGNEDFSRVWEL